MKKRTKLGYNVKPNFNMGKTNKNKTNSGLDFSQSKKGFILDTNR